MEKMFILIAFLFSAFAPEHIRIVDAPYHTVFLSTTSCSITSLTLDDVGECDNNGTADPFDDFFTVDILVEFENPPTTGQLRIELGEDAMAGGGPLEADVPDIIAQGSHTFEGIRIKADGDPTEIPVSFSAEPSCREVLSNGPAVASCSGLLPCEITSVVIDNASVCNNNNTADPSDDFFTARVSINFFNPPATGDLRIEPGGDALPGGGATSIPVGSLSNEFGHTFNGVRFKADGTVTVVEVEFTADNACVRTGTGPTVVSCSAALGCDISSVSFTNASTCIDNGTSDPADDFFTANVVVNFANPPATGNLLIEPGGDALPGGGATSVSVASLVGNTHTFTGVRFKADGTLTAAEVEFSANTNCVRTGFGPTVQSCSGSPGCGILEIEINNIEACNGNGTPNNPNDDFFIADVFIFFENPPSTGLLVLQGSDLVDGDRGVAIGNVLSVGSPFVFSNLRFKANGTPTELTAHFDADPNCILNSSGPGMESCCSLVIADVVTTAENCPNASDGGITITATTSAGPLTYAISGPVNQSNNTGVFSGLPDGNYTITVTDNGATNCSETASAVISAGVDLVPPTPVCRNTTVALDATGNYTLTTDDVLDLGASFDNCGTVSITGKFPETVSCVQVGQTIPVNVTVADGNGNLATCTAQITVQEGTALPTGFSSSNVGNANGTNTFQPCSGQKFTLTASGFSTSSADVLRLVSRQLCGSGEIIARVVGVTGGGWAGITLRETTASGSKKVALKTQFSNNIRREIRTMTNGAVNNLNFSRPQDNWLRLVRNGANFTGYTSMDGVNWNFAFSATVSMAGCIRVGLFSESINANVVTTAVFDQVTITGAAAPLIAPGAGSVVAFEAPDFQAYPNPTTGELNLDLQAFANRSVRLEIANVHGQTLNVLKLNPAAGNTERLDLSQFQAGIYLIAAKSEGWPAVVRRVVLMERR